jgi:hypothetical protein
MASADVTVIPTGGSTAVDLADLAAKVQALPSPDVRIRSTYYDGSGTLYTTIVKQTGIIEDFTLTIDSNPVTTSEATTILPDGWYNINCTSVPTSSGTHTFKIVTSVTAITKTATYTI